MTTRLQFVLILGSIIFFIFMMYAIRKNRISTDYATIWAILGILLITFSIFPGIFDYITVIFGLLSPVNTVFLFMIFILFIMVFYLYVKNSLLEDKLNKVIHEISILEQEKNKHF